MFVAKSEGVLRPLKFANVINKHAGSVALVMLADVIKISIHLGDNEARTTALQHVCNTSKAPPPVRFGIADFGIPDVSGGRGNVSGGRGKEQGGPSAPIQTTARGSVLTSSAAGDKYSKYIFPSELPDIVLLPHEMKEQYAIKNAPSKLKREIDQFIRWSGAPVNTERSGRYVRAVQTTTTDKQPSKIRAYIGYISTTYGVSTSDLSLDMYADPARIARFIGYLIAREVEIGHLRGHLGLARKINAFLQSGADEGSPAKKHAARMEGWLQTVEAQLSAAMPPAIKDGVPDIKETWKWVSNFVDAVLDQVDVEMRRDGQISHGTAWRLQQALLAALVTGRYCPPPRIHVLTSLIHPAYNGKIPCQDKDCQRGASCMGNHLELTRRDGLPMPEESMENSDMTEDDVEEDGTSSGSSLHFTGGGGSGKGPIEVAGDDAGRALDNHGEPVNLYLTLDNPDRNDGDLDGNVGDLGWPHFDYDTMGISHFVAHHKNDRLVE